VATAAWPVAAQILVLGLVHVVNCAVVNCAVVYTGVGIGARRVLGARPAAARWVSRISDAATIVIGTVLIAEQVFSHT